MTAGLPPEEAWEILDLDLREEFTPFLVFSTSVIDSLLFKTFPHFFPGSPLVVPSALPKDAMLELWTWNRA